MTIDRAVEEITPEAMQRLVEYGYPGNVREPSNFVERGVALAQGRVLGVEHLPQHLGRLTVRVFAPELAAAPTTLEAQEKAHILHALKPAAGNRGEAARMLGVDHVLLWRKLEEIRHE